MMYFRLAFKNLLRKKARLAVTLAAIAFGCGALIGSQGFINDGLYQIREQSIAGSLGHFQIAKKGRFEYGDSRPADFVISEPVKVEALVRALPHVRLVAPRLWLAGLLSNGDSTTPVMVAGVVPSVENRIGGQVKIIDGHNINDADKGQVTLGVGLARKFDGKVGQPMALLSSSSFGAISGLDVVVKGIYSTGSRYVDDWDLRAPLPVAQKLLETQGVTELVVYLDDTERTDEVMGQVRGLLAKDFPELEVWPWYQLETYHQQTKAFLGRQFWLLQLIIIVIVVLSVFNTLEMMVLDRIGEIGTTMALGFSRDAVVRMFLAEGAVLGLLGGLVGIAMALAAARVVQIVGIPMPPAPGLTNIWYAQLRWTLGDVAYAFVLSMGTAVFSAAWPAYKGAQIDIAEALRENV